MSVQEVQSKVTSSEFLKWIWYLDWKDSEEFNRHDFYLAQIALEIHRSYIKHPEKVKIQDKILKFNSVKKEGNQNMNKDNMISKSKNFWMGVTGMFSKKKKSKPIRGRK